MIVFENETLNAIGDLCSLLFPVAFYAPGIGGSVVDFSPATREACVSLPANAVHSLKSVAPPQKQILTVRGDPISQGRSFRSVVVITFA